MAILLAAVVAAVPGCTRPRPVPDDTTRSFSGRDDILDRCIAAYALVDTLHARGTLSDFRHGARRVAPVAWDLARPDRCRLQIDGDVAIVNGTACWTYRAATGRFMGNRTSTRTPMETSSSLLSDGAPFLVPTIWERGEAAFGKDRRRGYADWQLQGVAWSDERPCYVLFKKMASPSDRESLLRIWIDQDLLLLRRWSLVIPAPDGRERIIMEYADQELIVNRRLPSDIFQLSPPEPLDRPENSVKTERPTEDNSTGP